MLFPAVPPIPGAGPSAVPTPGTEDPPLEEAAIDADCPGAVATGADWTVAAVVGTGGGDSLPAAGNEPPLALLAGAFAGSALRLGLALTWCSVPAKSELLAALRAASGDAEGVADSAGALTTGMTGT